ncbi:MAG TPA: VWA domain-containing protein [Terriglobales bacterium]|nr:VWA domain-containing protein [Terriglobales bacterium]
MRTAATLVLALLVCPALLAQDDLATFKAEVNLVLLDATVRDRQGRVMTDLGKDDFRLLEDGREQRIQYFSRDELPLAIALVLDVSGSMKPTFAQLRRSMVYALDRLRPTDRAVLFAFSRDTERLTGLTSNHDQLADAMESVSARGGTDILDALWAASVYLKQQAPKDRRAVILISDNIAPKRAEHGTKEVIETALEFETEVHSLCVCNMPLGYALRFTQPAFARVNVSKIVKATGGALTKTGSDQTLIEALGQTLTRLRQRYTLGYTPDKRKDARPGQFHRVEIRLSPQIGKPGDDYTVSARSGYYTPSTP